MNSASSRWFSRRGAARAAGSDVSPRVNRRALVVGGLGLMVPPAYGQDSGSQDPGGDATPVTVASKGDAEGTLLGQMILQTLRRLGLPTRDRLQLGPTRIVRAALLAGEIDAYPEYTGNVAFFSGTETDPLWKSAQAGYEAARRFDAPHGLVWLARARANNSSQIAVRGSLARAQGLATMADFARAARAGLIRLAASAEFVESPAALAAYEAAYGFHLPREGIVTLPGGDTAVTLRAAAQGISGVNAGMVYGTDGAIDALDVVVMADPQGAQIVYEPAPVFRQAVLARHPAIAPALDRIFSGLDLPTLRRLNARIAVEGETPDAVARAYLG